MASATQSIHNYKSINHFLNEFIFTTHILAKWNPIKIQFSRNWILYTYLCLLQKTLLFQLPVLVLWYLQFCFRVWNISLAYKLKTTIKSSLMYCALNWVKMLVLWIIYYPFVPFLQINLNLCVLTSQTLKLFVSPFVRIEQLRKTNNGLIEKTIIDWCNIICAKWSTFLMCNFSTVPNYWVER